MKAGGGKRLRGAPPQGGRWTRRITRRGEPSHGRGGTLLLIAICLLVISAIAGFAWQMDRQIRGGILRQRTEAERRSDWVPLRSLPKWVPRIFVAVLDPEFSSRELLSDVDDPEHATLTRDLVRQVHLLNPGLRDDARLLAMSPLLEGRLSKDDILELYLNRARFGESAGMPVYGIGHAAREFFGKTPADLTLGEAATLAGLLLPPRIRNPQRRAGAVGARRNEVLRKLLVSGVIDEAAFRSARAEPLGFQPGLEHAPMSRPAGWQTPATPIRLPAPPELPDSVPRS